MSNNIKILVVCGKYPSAEDPLINIFLKEQVDALRRYHPDVEIRVFNLHTEANKLNYIIRRREFKNYVNNNSFDIVHYHYGLTALVGLYQKINAKQVITFHGSDLNLVKHHRLISHIAAKKFNKSIVVSYSIMEKKEIDNYTVIPCGVDTEIFKHMDKKECRKRLGLPLDKKLILFPGSKINPVKNYKFLQRTLAHIERNLFEVIELNNIKRRDVPLYMNAVDVIALTSIKEGSPQVLKEAALCKTPIVSVDVTDVTHIIEGSNNSHVVERDEKKFAEKILEAIEKGENTGFKNLGEYDNKLITHKLYELYKTLVGA